MGRDCVSHAGVPQRYAFQDDRGTSMIVPLCRKADTGNGREGWLSAIARLRSDGHTDSMNTETALCEMLAKFIGRKKVSDDSALLQDLGIAGDDAWELLEDINLRFGTDFSKMPFSAYFLDETEALGVHWVKLIGRRSSRRPLTVRHLGNVIDQGVWFDPSGSGTIA